MFKQEDKEYLNNPDYSMALEKFLNPKYYREVQENNAVDKIYPTTNEYIEGVFRGLGNINDESIVTVGSSGDQLLTAVLKGAKNITLIDANIFTKYFVEYKIAMIKNMSREKFYHLMKNHTATAEIFEPKTYQKIFHDLSPDSQQFWGSIFFEDIEPKLIAKTMFHNCFFSNATFYKNDDNYYTLRKKLNEKDLNIEYITAELSDFPKAIKGKHKAILLSNIYDYIPKNEISAQKSFRKTIKTLKRNNLKKNGVIQLYYNFIPAPAPRLEELLYNEASNIIRQTHYSDDSHIPSCSYFLSYRNPIKHITPKKPKFSFKEFFSDIKEHIKNKEGDYEQDRDK